ncbi:hypothetical protein PsorP6_002534 [Peronosclerospora sorghi]|uniref:Uncharacterized protein n=1 Tax=Peronosclerospora sorghi TaxID=230839 RepID=A0ACC0WU50_9STRA|nr:hypothetical protein PsorP6_002534 [Peronosclerospora sorghi]
MGPRGAGRRLNDQERMEILEIIQREAKVKNVDLAKRYGVSEGAIRKLKQMKDIVRNRYFMGNEHNRDKRKRGGFKRNAPFEQELYQWIVRMRESQPYQLMPLTQTAVRQQAIVLAKNYDKMANFKASPGWFARFCSRHRLGPIVASGDAAAATTAVLSSEGVPHLVSMPAAVVTTSDETAFLMDTLTAAPVPASQAMEMVNVTQVEIVSDIDQDCKAETPSINEQVQQAAREHNEAALRAAVAKIGDARALEKKDAEECKSMERLKVEEETEEKKFEVKSEHTVTAAAADDEIFSLGL